MESFKIHFKHSAEKELRKISPPSITNIIQKIKNLSHNPRPHGSEMLKGERRYFRFRQGDYRIIYEVDDLKQEVMIIKVGHRREVYDF